MASPANATQMGLRSDIGLISREMTRDIGFLTREIGFVTRDIGFVSCDIGFMTCTSLP
jgi:hypothetical protein